MTQNISIRRASTEDVDVLADFAARAFRDTFAADNRPADMENYLRDAFSVKIVQTELEDAGNTFLIACVEGDDLPAGYAKLSVTTQHPHVSAQSAIEIERLYVAKAAIGRGIGAALMRACFAEAQASGSDAIWLGVWEKNMRAIRFYRRWGFETRGERQFKLGSDIQNDLIMSIDSREPMRNAVTHVVYPGIA